jgi:hypothetical protein
MLTNRALRLRHFWQFASWINNHNGAQKLLGDKKYGIEYRISRAKELKYYLAPAHSNYFKPAITQDNVQNGKTGTMDLLLYKVGQDETQYNVKNGACLYDSVLVVRLKLHYRFASNADGSTITGWPSQRTRLRAFQNAVDRFNGRLGPRWLFALEASTGDFQRCVVYFLPVYDASPAAPGDYHFQFEVRPSAAVAANNRMDIERFTENHIKGLAARVGKTVKLVDTADQVSLFRYCLGLSARRKVAERTRWDRRFRRGDLVFLERWMESKCPGTSYRVKRY